MDTKMRHLCSVCILCKVQAKKNLFSKNVFAYKKSYNNTKVTGFIMGYITLNDIVTKQLVECPFTLTTSYTLWSSKSMFDVNVFLLFQSHLPKCKTKCHILNQNTHISSRLTSPPQDLCLQGCAVPHQAQASLNHNETHNVWWQKFAPWWCCN